MRLHTIQNYDEANYFVKKKFLPKKIKNITKKMLNKGTCPNSKSAHC